MSDVVKNKNTDGINGVLQSRKGWKECQLVDIATIQTGPFGSQLKNEQYITGGTPVVTVEHISNFRITDFNYPSVTDEDKQRLSRYHLSKGDIIFTRVGSVDLSAYVKPHQDGWLFSSRMLRVKPNKNIDSRFLSYFFQQKQFREYMLSIAVGATMPSINTGILKGIPISYPPFPEQKAIATILSSLDDKIDLLHRQNKTLEAMAETLFRQWFVEEAGADWEETTLGQCGKIVTGKTPSTKRNELWGEDVPFVTPTDFKNYNKYTIGTERHLSSLGMANVEKNILPKNSILVTCIGSDMGKVAISNSICVTNQQINSLIVDKNFPSIEYIYYFLKDIYPLLRSMALGGTTMPIINKSEFEKIKLPLPPEALLVQFENKVTSQSKKIFLNTLQINTLSKLRDNLLPKLMSGEVRVWT